MTASISVMDESESQASERSSWAPPPLHAAALAGDVHELQALLDSGTRDAPDEKRWRATALLHAASRGHVECVRMLLRHTDDVDQRNATGLTALYCALCNGHVACASVLLDRGASLDATDQKGRLAAHRAIINGRVSCIKLLLSRIWPGSRQELYKVLQLAVVHNQVEILRLLLRQDGSAGGWAYQEPMLKKSRHSRVHHSALVTAAKMGHVSCTRVLLEVGVDPREQLEGRCSALYYSLSGGHWAIAELLLSYGADIDGSCCYRQPPLGYFAGVHNYAVTLWVLEHGAGVAHRDSKGRSALHWALQSSGDTLECVQLLLSRGAVGAVSDEDGRTPLHVAASRGNMHGTMLLDGVAGVDVNALDTVRS